MNVIPLRPAISITPSTLAPNRPDTRSRIQWPLPPSLMRYECRDDQQNDQQNDAEEAGNALRCLACARQCLLREDAVGYCTAVQNLGGTLYNTAYGVIAEASVTPIESKPVYHFRPGSRVLSLGGLGCNLRCKFCQNWEIAFRDARHGGGLEQPNLMPEDAVSLALNHGCQGLAWSHNEPSITPSYTLESARLARQSGLFTVFVTNGLCTHEALAVLGPYLDVYRVDVKSIQPKFYQQVGSFSRIQNILPVARQAQQEFGIHVEVVTNIMPGLNDSHEHLHQLANSLVDTLGPAVPWHLTTYIPYALMTHIPPTPPETVLAARTIARQAGIHFVYCDIAEDPAGANTYCPTCGSLAVERLKGRVRIHRLTAEGICTACHEPLPISLHSGDTHRDSHEVRTIV